MLFLPIGCLIFILFILALPILFILGYLHIITVGFENLGISPELTLFLLLAILIGSAINIPLTRKKIIYKEESLFFGLWKTPKIEAQGVAINLGGAVIPLLLSFYFLYLSWQAGINLQTIITAFILMVVLTKFLSRIVPGRGISLPAFIPPVFSAIFALILAPDFPAVCAFISGTLGTLVGADILNLKQAQKQGGFISIGGAGIFDGIFLVGIISALLAGF
jgi:uncharacterized membrane protein